MFWRVAGGVERLDRHVAEVEQIAVAHCAKRRGGGRVGEENVFGPGRLGERAPRGQVIGMDVRVNDVANLQPGLSGRVEIARDVADRVDDRAGGLAAAAEQIRDADRIGVQELSQDHAKPPLKRECELARSPAPFRRLTISQIFIQFVD